MQKRSFIFAAFAAIILCIVCENPFATREPEPPKTSQSNWIQPTSPSYVLANLKNAIFEKNKSNYMRCLADTSVSNHKFKFIADPAVINANPGLFTHWGREEEANYLNQLYNRLPKDSTMSVVFQRLEETTFQDSVILLQTYKLVFDEKCQAGEQCMRYMEGQAEFRLLRTEDDVWYIYRWSDFSTSDSLTWSDIKARFGK